MIGGLAASNHGVVERSRLVSAGIAPGAIDRRIAAGVLIPLHRGVYAVGHAHLRPEGRWLASVWAVGSGAALSHRHAAALWDVLPEPPRGRVHVTLVGRAGRVRRPGVVIHRPRRLDDCDVTQHRGIPVVGVARTLLDLAVVTRGRHLEQLVRTASRAQRLDVVAMDDVLARYPHHPGRRELARVLGSVVGQGTEDLRSVLETRFLQLCDDHDLPKPIVNGFVAGHRVDFHWPSARLVVETDGFEWHATPTTFAADRRRDQRLALAGFRVLRFSYDDVRSAPRRVVATVAALLTRADGAA